MSHLTNLGTPVCCVPDLAREMGIDYSTLYNRLNKYPHMTRPVTFKAGGQQMLMVDDARLWVEKHKAEWAALQAAKQNPQK